MPGEAPAAGAEQRLEKLGHRLPEPPTPLGAYVEAVRSGNLLFLSGMLPVVDHKPEYLGRLGGELSVEDGRKSAVTATLNALSVAKSFLGSLDNITGVPKLSVYIATEGDFRQHPKVADGASELLLEVFGRDKLSSRVVLGVASLPLGVSVELEIVFEVAPGGGDGVERLSDRYHLIAPDYPSFGHSEAPDPRAFRYTFDNIAWIME